jgi:hypothetical protein
LCIVRLKNMNTVYFDVSTVSRRLLRRRGPSSIPCDICSRQSGTGIIFLVVLRFFPLPLFRQCSTLAHIFFLFSSPLALQPSVGFGLSNNIPRFFHICHQLSPSSHS